MSNKAGKNILDATLRAGQYAPAFTLRDAHGARVTSAGLLKHGPLVVMFYRGSWCPYCQEELTAAETVLSDLLTTGARVIAISPEVNPAGVGGQLELFSDRHNRVAKLFGLAYALSPRLKESHKRSGINLVAMNGDESWTLPLVARFVIAPDRMVLYSQVHAEHTVRMDPSNVLPVLTAYKQRLLQDPVVSRNN